MVGDLSRVVALIRSGTVLARGRPGTPPRARSHGCAGGTRHAGGGPAVPPSLAAIVACRPVCDPLGSVLLPVLLILGRPGGRRGGRSSGGSGVIWSAARIPGLAPSPVAPGRRSGSCPHQRRAVCQDSRCPAAPRTRFAARRPAAPTPPGRPSHHPARRPAAGLSGAAGGRVCHGPPNPLTSPDCPPPRSLPSGTPGRPALTSSIRLQA